MFLTLPWLDGFFTINFPNGTDPRPIPDTDVRSNGMLSLYYIMGLCNFSEEAVEKSKAFFLIDQYVEANALSRKSIDIFMHIRSTAIIFLNISSFFPYWQIMICVS